MKQQTEGSFSAVPRFARNLAAMLATTAMLATATPAQSFHPCGDVNSDATVSAVDALIVLQKAVGLLPAAMLCHDCCASTTTSSTTTTTLSPTTTTLPPALPCEDPGVTPPTCSGDCPPGLGCSDIGHGCTCLPEVLPCVDPGTMAPMCDGACAPGELCVPDISGLGGCLCTPSGGDLCGAVGAPECLGECPPGLACFAVPAVPGTCLASGAPCLLDADCLPGEPCISDCSCH
ncbi:MAG: hypothetical protein H8E45_09935 [Proteobacteria bacterium]|nr:hypothetical protein [Pseudomonadota bacterium]